MLDVGDQPQASLRRRADRTPPVLVSLRFSEEQVQGSGRDENASSRHHAIDAELGPKRTRDRRKDSTGESARRFSTSLREYLMVNDYERSGEMVRRVKKPAPSSNGS